MSLTPPYYTPNPYFADAQIVVASPGYPDLNFMEIPPQYLSEFIYKRTAENGASECEFTLVDREWDVLEGFLLKGNDIVKIRYGYTKGGLRGPMKGENYWYTTSVFMVTPEFRIDHAALRVQTLSAAVSCDGHATKTNHSWGPGMTCEWRRGEESDPPVPAPGGTPREYPVGLTIAQIVQEICWKNGWIPRIDNTEELRARIDLETSGPVHKKWEQDNLSDLEFIKHKLRGSAIRLRDKHGGYTIHLTELSEVDKLLPELYFHPPPFHKKPVREFYYMRDHRSEVISFSPNLMIVPIMRLGGGQTAKQTVDQDTDEASYSSKGIYDMSQIMEMGEKSILGNYVEMAPKFTGGAKALRNLVRPALNKIHADKLVKHRFIEMFNRCITATMVTMGDPSVEVEDVVKVFVFTPDGRLHYTSGNYNVFEIIDTIAGGNFHSTLILQKNAFIKGDHYLENPQAVPEGKKNETEKTQPPMAPDIDPINRPVT